MKLTFSGLLFLSLLACAQLNWTSNANFAGVQQSEKLTFTVDTILSDLTSPWSMTWLPNGDMLFTEKAGELRLYSNGKLHPDPIAGLPEIKAKGQGGLLDIELHPNYEENGWLYFSYASPAKEGEAGEGQNTALYRAKLKDHSLVEGQEIFKALPNYKKGQHFAGRIEFDREGYLYLSVGDRGGRDEVQTLTSSRGRVYRMHDDGSTPEDNPFVGEEGVWEQMYSYGHRNPQGLALHPETGELWEHEHGPQGGDEVNIVRAGKNYGWPEITFGINYNGTTITEDTAKAGMEQPVTYWVPSIAPCGMDFVESDMYPDWKGNLLVGSLKFQYLKRLELEGNKVTHQEVLLEGLGRVRCVRQAPDGYIYVSTEGPGMIVRLKPE
ncbi:MAG: PQQ-dependent sugar dehydrogenase [Bacteroidota bacterium]